MGYAFISYSHKNEKEALALRGLLEKNHTRTWLASYNIPIGCSYVESIKNAIKNCSCFLLIISEEAMNSAHVKKELSLALSAKRTIIPIMVEDVPLTEEFVLLIGNIQLFFIANINNTSPKTQMLVESIKQFTITEEGQEEDQKEGQEEGQEECQEKGVSAQTSSDSSQTETSNNNFIFISYSHIDKDCVMPIMNKLEAEGYNIWYDDGINPGSEWDENIASHINECSYFIAFMSNNYLSSENCKDELKYARKKNKKSLLIYIEECELTPGMDMRTNRIQCIYEHKYESKDKFFSKLFSAEDIGLCKK